jgi:hypothetical protein
MEKDYLPIHNEPNLIKFYTSTNTLIVQTSEA